MKFQDIPLRKLFLNTYLLVVSGIFYQSVSHAQCENPCPPGGNIFVHFNWDNFCADDTAILWITWDNNFVPDSFYWRLEGPNGENPIILSPTDNDTIFVIGGAMAWYFGYIVDTSGCCEWHGWSLQLPYTPLFDAIIEPSHCNEPTGSIILSLLPGGAPGDEITYLWSNGSTDFFLLDVPAGTYTVTVIRENLGGVACPVEYTYTVPLIDTLHLEAELQMDNSCVLDNGSIDLTVTYPGLNYNYLWSNGSEEEDLQNIPPGVYTVTVTGPAPCVDTATYIISDESFPIDLALEDITPTYCDLPVGGADISVIGGADPITYVWSDFETTQDAFELTSGTHYVTVTGDDDCTAVLEVNIPNYDSLFSVTATITSNTNCLIANGAIDLQPQPEGFYSYNWPASHEEDISNLVSGIYPVTITAGSCVLLDTFFVPENFSLPSLAATITETMCGDSSGMIDLEVSGGIMPYNYIWSDSTSIQDKANLATGFYSVTVTGQNGCSVSDTFAIQTETQGFTVTAVLSSNSGCTNPNGSIDLSVLPADTFSFLWSTGADTEDIHQLQQNNYTVTITNDQLCTYVYSFQILDSLSPPDTTHILQTSCNILQVGLDTLVMQNQIGCDSILVLNTSFLPLDTSFQQGVVCDPGDEGRIIENILSSNGCDSIVVTDYLFMGIDTTQIIANTCDVSLAGIHYQTHTNSVGCDSVIEAILVLSISDTTFIQSSTCDASQSGTFYITFSNVFGCDSIVKQEISLFPSQHINTSATTCKLSEAGVFVDSFINQYGCDSIVTLTVSLIPLDTTFLSFKTCDPSDVETIETTLTNQEGCDSLVIEETTLYPLPQLQLEITSDYNGYAISCAGQSDGSALANTTGFPPFQYLWSTTSTDPAITGLSAGMYAVTVTDGNGCIASSEVVLFEPEEFSISFIVSHPDCFDNNDGSIIVEQSGGVEPVRYSIDGINYQSSHLFDQLPGGTYTITALDANDCETKEIIWINVPLMVNVELPDDQLAFPGDTVYIQAVVNVPFDSLTNVVWSGLVNSQCPNCLSQPVAPIITTTYSVKVTTNDGCSDEDAVSLFLESSNDVFVPNVFSPNGDGVNDVLLVSAGSNIEEILEFSVFDRWGNVIYFDEHFTPNDPTRAWDGTMKGRQLNPGVFVYKMIVHVVDGTTNSFYGNITIVR